MLIVGSAFNSGGKITLDHDTFKVLASETRIGILKKLDKTRMTVTDLSKALDMSKATLFEHLEKLMKAGLIKKIKDQRKWVYYKLSWKGKKILHPERMKIAIVLSLFIISFIILVSFFFITSSKDLEDNTAPTIEFFQIEDINENTVSPSEIIIQVEDNEQIDKSSIEIEYTFHDTYTQNYNLISNWRRLEGTVKNNKVMVPFPDLSWELKVDKYLYIKCTAFDKTGNQAQEVFIEYIENIYGNNIDISIMLSDIEIDKDFTKIPLEGHQDIPIKIKVHNTGSFDIRNVGFFVFNIDPDLNNDGINDNKTEPIKNFMVDLLEQGSLVTIDLNVNVNLSEIDRIWIFADPSNLHNESNELNNIIEVNIKNRIKSKTSEIPEFPLVIGVFIVILVIIVQNLAYGKNCRSGK